MLLGVQLVKGKPTGDIASVEQADDVIALHDGQWIGLRLRERA
jgi:hypothetical protein